MTKVRPADQPGLFTLLVGGEHVYPGGSETYPGYANLNPVRDEKANISKMMERLADKGKFVELVERIVKHANGDIESANAMRPADVQHIPYDETDMAEAMDAVYAAYRSNVQRYCDVRTDLYLKYQQEAGQGQVSRGASLRMQAVQMVFADKPKD